MKAAEEADMGLNEKDSELRLQQESLDAALAKANLVPLHDA